MGKNITIQKILRILLHRLPLIILSGALMAVIFFLYTSFFVKPVSSASAVLYVQNYGKQNNQSATTAATTATDPKKQTATTAPNKVTDDADAALVADGKKGSSSGNDSVSSNNDLAQKIFASDMAASATLAKNCIIMFNNAPIVQEQYKGCSVTMTTIDDSFYIRITATGKDKDKVAIAPQNIVTACSEVFYGSIGYGNLREVSIDKVAHASKSSRQQSAMIGGAIGVIIACVISILLELIDTTIKHDDDLSGMYKVPVFAEIPDFENSGR